MNRRTIMFWMLLVIVSHVVHGIIMVLSILFGGTTLTAVMSGGSGNSDLYVKEGSQPSRTSWDCRSRNRGNNETCTVDAGRDVYVSIYGEKAGSYDLSVTYIQPD